jgi:hypothetical protein
VFYCLPVLGVVLGQIALISLSVKKEISLRLLLLYFFIVIVVSIVFNLENIKNGALYEAILGIFGCLIILVRGRNNWNLKKLFQVMVLVGVISFFTLLNVNKNESWKNFIVDLKIASQVDEYRAWVDNGPLPLNELLIPVSGTNYDRISWGIISFQLISQYPMGYGVLENSFGQLARKNWPNTTVTQSHSGWLDLTMGIGIPGVLLIIGGLISGLIRVNRNIAVSDAWKSSANWIVFSICILFFTTEVSQKIYLESVFLIIGLIIGLGLYSPLKNRDYQITEIRNS